MSLFAQYRPASHRDNASPIVNAHGHLWRRVSSVRSSFVAALLVATVLVAPSDAADTNEGALQGGAIAKETVIPEQVLLDRMEEVGSVRIVMHAREPADRLADQLSSLLSSLGAASVERRTVDEVPESNQVRFYYSADREAGQVVGDALELVFDEVAVRDFGDYQPAPSQGLIEIWLR